MLSQFIRVETYAGVVGTHKKLGTTSADAAARIRASAQQVVDEAFRASHAAPHVVNPHQPKLLYGMTHSELSAHLVELTTSGRDVIGRKLRKDALILLGGIISYPAELFNGQDLESHHCWELSLSFLKRKYGYNLKSVLLHTDEANPHLHFFCTPMMAENSQVAHIRTIHDGIRASDNAQSESSKVKKYKYDAAMREFQNEYHSEVGAKLGLVKGVSGIRGKPRKEWIQLKEQTNQLMSFLETQDKDKIMKDILEKKSAENARQLDAISAHHKVLDAREFEITTRHDELDAREAQIEEAEVNVLIKTRHIDNLFESLNGSIKLILSGHGSTISEQFEKLSASLKSSWVATKNLLSKLTESEERIKETNQKWTSLRYSLDNTKLASTIEQNKLLMSVTQEDSKIMRTVLSFIEQNQLGFAVSILKKALKNDSGSGVKTGNTACDR